MKAEKIKGYLFTINFNNPVKLDQDELKDVLQDVTLYLLDKNYNDLLQKKSIKRYYEFAVERKLNADKILSSGVYFQMDSDQTDHDELSELENNRSKKLKSLGLEKKQKKILELLIKGFSYQEIRKKLKLNERQLRNMIYQIKLKTVH